MWHSLSTPSLSMPASQQEHNHNKYAHIETDGCYYTHMYMYSRKAKNIYLSIYLSHSVHLYMSIYLTRFIQNYFSLAIYHHHHVSLLERIFLTLFRHSSLSSIVLERSFKLHHASAFCCCRKVLPGRPTLARPCKWVHRSYIVNEFVLTLPAVSHMPGLSNLCSFRVGL